jgi:hypothetical protein
MTVCIGAHVPKCAGTTILRRVQSCLDSSKIYQNTSMAENFRNGRPEIMQMARRDHLRFLWGHSIHEEMLRYFKEDVFLFTGLREPRDRMSSMYFYHVRIAKENGNPFLSVEDFVDSTNNPICNFFIHRFPTLAGTEGSLSDRAKRVLNLFDLVYFSEDLEPSAEIIFNVLGIAPKTENFNARPDSELGKKIEINDDSIQEDLILYDFAKNIHAVNNTKHDASERQLHNDKIRKSVLSGWVNEANLGSFLYHQSLIEYKSWNALDNVISTRMAQIRAITQEISVYARKSTV